MIPEKKCESQMGEEGKILLRIPRFKNKWMKRIGLNLGKSEFFNISLDALGTRVWNLIDGTRTVEQIGMVLEKEDGSENQEPILQLYERLTKYFSMLLYHGFVDFKNNEQ